MIKKCRYCPKYICGNDVKAHFNDKEVGDLDAWPGNLEGVDFHVFVIKEPDYVMSLMSIYGTLSTMSQRETSHEYKQGNVIHKKTFKYPEVVNNHFLYQHAVDDHNQKIHMPISMEETWGTKRWLNHVFAFLLAVMEVNVMLATYFFKETYSGMLDFQKVLAKELIDSNNYL